jgi:hypothetical protein
VRGDNIYSPDFRAHMARVMAGLDMTINMLREADARDAQLAHIKQQHIGFDVDAKYFEVSFIPLQYFTNKNHLSDFKHFLKVIIYQIVFY